MYLIAKLKWNLDDLSTALKVNQESVLRFLRDGRNAAFLLKFYLCKRLKWQLVEGYNAPTHLVDDYGGVWIIKTCTKVSGVSFCKNTMIGKGRKFNAKDFLSFLKEPAGFLVCDVESFPEVLVYTVKSEKALEFFNHGALKDGRMKYSVFENYVNALN